MGKTPNERLDDSRAHLGRGLVAFRSRMVNFVLASYGQPSFSPLLYTELAILECIHVTWHARRYFVFKFVQPVASVADRVLNFTRDSGCPNGLGQQKPANRKHIPSRASRQSNA